MAQAKKLFLEPVNPWNKETKELSVITEKPILRDLFFTTREHVFYISEKSPDTLIRVDLKGENKTEIYKSGGPEISGFIITEPILRGSFF